MHYGIEFLVNGAELELTQAHLAGERERCRSEQSGNNHPGYNGAGNSVAHDYIFLAVIETSHECRPPRTSMVVSTAGNRVGS